MKVTLIAHSPEPEKVIAAAAKLCYSASDIDNLLDNLTPEKTTSFVEMLSNIGHESPIEHASFTFGIEGVSRALLAQITRHRLASFSVQSQRYVKNKNFTFVTPPEIENNPEAKELFLKSMNDSITAYNNIADILEKKYFGILMEFAKTHFDYVLIDCAPIGAAIDAAVVAKHCDGAILVISQGVASSRLIMSVKKQLEASGIRILGAVLNKVKMGKSGYGYGYGYGYGKYYGGYYGAYYGNYSNTEEKE